MIKLRLEGHWNHVQAFLQDIRQYSSMDFDLKDYSLFYCEKNDQMTASCIIHYVPVQKYKIVEIVTEDGKIVQIPMADVTKVKLDEGVSIFFGKSIDVFS